MRILLDQGTPGPLKRHLPGHHVETAAERGWSALFNGELLNEAESSGFAVLITTDQKLRYQQNLKGRAIAILVLTRASWPRIRTKADGIAAAVADLPPGGYAEFTV